MIKQAGIDFPDLPDEEIDAPLGISTGAADIFGATPAASWRRRCAPPGAIVTGEPLPFDNVDVEPVRGLEGVKERSAKSPVRRLGIPRRRDLRSPWPTAWATPGRSSSRSSTGKAEYHFIEIMTCPGGCIGGGGQPRFTTERGPQKRASRRIYDEDEASASCASRTRTRRSAASSTRSSSASRSARSSHQLLHTHYFEHERV